jgi:hypothetical protein
VDLLWSSESIGTLISVFVFVCDSPRSSDSIRERDLLVRLRVAYHGLTRAWARVYACLCVGDVCVYVHVVYLSACPRVSVCLHCVCACMSVCMHESVSV